MWSRDSLNGKCPTTEMEVMPFLNLTVQKDRTISQSLKRPLILLTPRNMKWRNNKEETKNSDKKLRKGDQLRNDCLYFYLY